MIELPFPAETFNAMDQDGTGTVELNIVQVHQIISMTISIDQSINLSLSLSQSNTILTIILHISNTISHCLYHNIIGLLSPVAEPDPGLTWYCPLVANSHPAVHAGLSQKHIAAC